VNSLVLQTATRALQPLMLLVSIFLLLRGHHQPGGGFVGGLVAATAFGLHAMAFGLRSTRQNLRFDPRALAGVGVVLALASGSISLFAGLPFMTGLWMRLDHSVAGGFELGSPLLFDIGVYLTVSGASLCVLLALERE
jgi:multicomponent Na+:H+ antiporter subunit B